MEKIYNWTSDESYTEWKNDVMDFFSLPVELRDKFYNNFGMTFDLGWDDKETPENIAVIILCEILEEDPRKYISSKD